LFSLLGRVVNIFRETLLDLGVPEPGQQDWGGNDVETIRCGRDFADP